MKKMITITAVLLATSIGISMGQSRRASERSSKDENKKEVRSQAPSSRSNSRSVNSTKSTTTRSNTNVNRSTGSTSRSSTTTTRTRTEPQRESRDVNRSGSTSRTSTTTTRTRIEPQRESRDVNRTGVSREHQSAPSGRTTTRTTTTTVNKPDNRVHGQPERNRRVESSPQRHNNVNSDRSRQYTSSRRYVQRHTTVHHHHNYRPHSREYRSQHIVYRRPVHIDIVWSPRVFREYTVIYPELRHWRYDRRYRLYSISAYDAYYHVGELRQVYGRVSDVHYERKTDEFFLYIGDYYPYHDFSVVVPGWIARQYSRRPQWYFQKEHIAVTGLISVWDNKPEMVIGRADQMVVY